MAHLQAENYVFKGVRDAQAKSIYGWHFGPIPYANNGWIPPRQADAAKAGQPIPQVAPRDNADESRPHDAETVSTLNAGICCIDLDGAGTMCGVILGSQPAVGPRLKRPFSENQLELTYVKLRRHLRQSHPGAVINPRRMNLTNSERLAGTSSLKHVVLTKIWRNALFAQEPGRGPPGGKIDEYATSLEHIAATNADFAAEWGTRFHREAVHLEMKDCPRQASSIVVNTDSYRRSLPKDDELGRATPNSRSEERSGQASIEPPKAPEPRSRQVRRSGLVARRGRPSTSRGASRGTKREQPQLPSQSTAPSSRKRTVRTTLKSICRKNANEMQRDSSHGRRDKPADGTTASRAIMLGSSPPPQAASDSASATTSSGGSWCDF